MINLGLDMDRWCCHGQSVRRWFSFCERIPVRLLLSCASSPLSQQKAVNKSIINSNRDSKDVFYWIGRRVSNKATPCRCQSNAECKTLKLIVHCSGWRLLNWYPHTAEWESLHQCLPLWGLIKPNVINRTRCATDVCAPNAAQQCVGKKFWQPTEAANARFTGVDPWMLHFRCNLRLFGREWRVIKDRLI